MEIIQVWKLLMEIIQVWKLFMEIIQVSKLFMEIIQLWKPGLENGVHPSAGFRIQSGPSGLRSIHLPGWIWKGGSFSNKIFEEVQEFVKQKANCERKLCGDVPPCWVNVSAKFAYMFTTFLVSPHARHRTHGTARKLERSIPQK